MTNLQFDKSSVANQNQPIPRGAPHVYRHPPGAANSPNQAGGEVRPGAMGARTNRAGDSPVRR